MPSKKKAAPGLPTVPRAPVRETAPPSPGAAAGGVTWTVRLLGALEACRGEQRITNFGNRGVALLLARVALYPHRSHSREELIELLWPGVAIDVGRNRLRQALFTLRQLLEPPGPLPAPVLVADRLSIRVVPGSLECDAVRFEKAVRESRGEEASSLYAGELMPGYYDDWIDDERVRLVALRERLRDELPAMPARSDAPADARTDQASGRSAMPAPAAAADVGRNSMPIYLTRFFGREADAAQLRAEVMAHRLVTLLGPGGGKTRLAVEVAAALREARPCTGSAMPFDVVAFVPLAGCRTRPQALDALLAALHLRADGSSEDARASLVDAFAGRRALLVLDNFEQLCGVADDVIAHLAASIIGLHVLVTSRRALGLDGEREIVVPSLALPRRGIALHDAALCPAIALFVDRARAVRADFHAGPGNVDALIELAHLLEGMPLAIELAAARVRSIAPAAMTGLLRAARAAPGGRWLELLHRSGPRSGFDTRHASMLGVIEWSWNLLAAPHARMLAALTVFHGGFSARAAQAVCGDLCDPVELGLDELVAHSLLRPERRNGADDAGATRFGSFEPVREFAARQLAPDEARARRAGHRAWMRDWTAGLPATPSLAEVRDETPNLLAALASALADGLPDEAIRLALPLRRVLEDVELPAAGIALLEQAVGLCADPPLRSQGQTLLGPLLFNAGRREEATAHARAGLAGAPPGSPWRGRALHAAARVGWRVHRDPSMPAPLIAEGEQLAAAASDLELQASFLALRAFIANHGRDTATGRRLHEQALACWERLGNEHAINSGRYNLAVSAQIAGRQAEALDRPAELEPSVRALHDWRRLSQALNVRGNAQSELRRWGDAVAAYGECIRLAWDCMALHELAYGLWNLPRALAHERDAERAVELAAFVAGFWETRFGALSAGDRHDLRRLRRLALCQLGARRYDALWERGRRLPLAEAVAIALRR
jgi:predicted ATPase/tetratricopeptide (TPR) repeat protein